MLIPYVDAILSIFLALYVGKFLCLICVGLVPAHHIPTQEVSIEMYAIITTILVCIGLALSSILFPSVFVTICFSNYIVYYCD